MKIPYFKQDTDYTCGPATLQMAFAYYGNKQSEMDLAKKMKTNSNVGTTHKRMIKVANQNGFYAYVNNNSNFDEIVYFLNRKKPVVTHFIEPSSDAGHYAVITSINDKKEIVLNDPWNGKNFTMNKKDFLERWRDKKGLFINWIMVISPDKINNGKQYFPKK